MLILIISLILYPVFFYEYDFDKKHGRHLSPHAFHGYVSIRKFIIDNINNIDLLYAVRRSKDKRLKKSNKIPRKIYRNTVIIHFQEYSTYELVKYRIEELRNEEERGLGASNYPY